MSEEKVPPPPEGGEAADDGCLVGGHRTAEELPEYGEGVDPGNAPILSGDAPGMFGESAGVVMPPWCVEGPPKTDEFRWPGGAFSPTWLKMIQECAYKHAEVYRRKVKDLGGEDADVGTAVHEVLEWAGVRRLRRTWRDLPRKASVEELLHLLTFNEQARRSAVVRERAAEILRTIGEFDFTGILATETTLQLQLNHDVTIASIADLVTAEGANPQAWDQVTVYDYKTGEYAPSEAELFNDVQAQVNVIAARRKWSSARRVVFVILNVAKGERIELAYSTALERAFELTAKSAVNTWRMKDETANPGKDHCSYCHLRMRCEPLKKWYDQQRRRSDFPNDLSKLPIEQKITLYRDMQVLHKLSEARKKDLGELIEKDIPRSMREYTVGRLVAERRQNTFTAWRDEIQAIMELAQVAGVDFLSLLRDLTGAGIGVARLKSWRSGLAEEVRFRVDQVIKARTYTGAGKPYLQVRERKTKNPLKALF